MNLSQNFDALNNTTYRKGKNKKKNEEMLKL